MMAKRKQNRQKRQTKKRSRNSAGWFSSRRQKSLGNDLLSQGVAPPVPSALAGLTAGFEMGPGVPPPLESPRDFCNDIDCQLYIN
jgi:hypothetical protein